MIYIQTHLKSSFNFSIIHQKLLESETVPVVYLIPKIGNFKVPLRHYHIMKSFCCLGLNLLCFYFVGNFVKNQLIFSLLPA